MWTAGGAGGSGFGGPGGPGGLGDPAALAQQYWNALTEAMRSADGGARQSQLAGSARKAPGRDHTGKQFQRIGFIEEFFVGYRNGITQT